MAAGRGPPAVVIMHSGTGAALAVTGGEVGDACLLLISVVRIRIRIH
jgi:hypothetical protein